MRGDAALRSIGGQGYGLLESFDWSTVWSRSWSRGRWYAARCSSSPKSLSPHRIVVKIQRGIVRSVELVLFLNLTVRKTDFDYDAAPLAKGLSVTAGGG